MSPRSSWFRHGFLNTLEHGVTRGSDALASLVLLWTLSPESFSKLALAQALVAPLLLFFLSPETVLYRDFSKWKTAGPSVIASKIRAFRRFAWGKAQFALLLSGVIAFAPPLLAAPSGPHDDPRTRFAALLWAFGLSLAPQISGPDREFLRLELRLRELNLLSLYQKAVLILGFLGVAFLKPGHPVEWLAGATVFSALTTAWIAKRAADRALAVPQGDAPAQSAVSVLSESLHSFSFWQHLSGVIQNWVQTMDLFFLGAFHLPAREVGLYAAALKIANFSNALPTALSNSFTIWLGRRVAADGPGRELRDTSRLSLAMLAVAGAQGGILFLASPWAFNALSHGRWSASEQEWMRSWLGWILAGTVVFAPAQLIACWLMLRRSVRDLLPRIYLPWGMVSAAVYSGAIALNRALPGDALHAAAVCNLGVAAVFLFLVLLDFGRAQKPA